VSEQLINTYAIYAVPSRGSQFAAIGKIPAQPPQPELQSLSLIDGRSTALVEGKAFLYHDLVPKREKLIGPTE
jgi:hypothetical protein